MLRLLDLDLRSILSELRSRNYVASHEALGATRGIFRTNEHGYRRIDDHSLLHVMNFKAGESDSLTMARTDLVCFQILINGSYSRFVADRVDLMTSSAVLVSNYPQSTSDVSAGMKLRGVMIAVERQYLLDHFMLNVDNMPATYRPIFLKETGLTAAMRLPTTIAAVTAADQLLSCKFGEPLRGIYLQLKATEIICEIVAQMNAPSMRGPLRTQGFHRNLLQSRRRPLSTGEKSPTRRLSSSWPSVLGSIETISRRVFVIFSARRLTHSATCFAWNRLKICLIAEGSPSARSRDK